MSMAVMEDRVLERVTDLTQVFHDGDLALDLLHHALLPQLGPVQDLHVLRASQSAPAGVLRVCRIWRKLVSS